MFGQLLPIGINVGSPVTWFVVCVVIVVLALTVSTRRGNRRPPIVASDDWPAAQALFVEDPRAGCERAQALVTRRRERGAANVISSELERRFGQAILTVAAPDASTDALREAFLEFRAIFDSYGSAAATKPDVRP